MTHWTGIYSYISWKSKEWGIGIFKCSTTIGTDCRWWISRAVITEICLNVFWGDSGGTSVSHYLKCGGGYAVVCHWVSLVVVLMGGQDG